MLPICWKCFFKSITIKHCLILVSIFANPSVVPGSVAWMSPGACWKHRPSGPISDLRKQNLYFSKAPRCLNASVGKVSLFLGGNRLLCHSCSLSVGRTPWSWPPTASHSAYEKSTRDLGILVGGSFQPITGQLMQLLAAIIGRHCSHMLLASAHWRGPPCPPAGQVFSQKYLFSFPLHHSIFTRMKKLWFISFSKVNHCCLS